MYYVYIIQISGKRRFYVGVTANISRRLREHKIGCVSSTKGKFLKLVHIENFESKAEAWKREKMLKSGKGREWILNNVLSLGR